jgi:hypothetical protein
MSWIRKGQNLTGHCLISSVVDDHMRALKATRVCVDHSVTLQNLYYNTKT